MEEVETRFSYLLQPIRDLTKNWEVDVAAQLGEYIEELEQICISFDGGKTTMNFAEAALLIQGSACIYSKKVEYLYTLVYQALDFISNKKRAQQPTSVGPDGLDKDANFPNHTKEEFLVLDDIGDPKKTNVDMKDQNPNLVTIVPLTPVTLVAPEEIEKKTNPLCSCKGEVLASRKDFRMNSYTPHAYGMFLLDLNLMSPTQFMKSTPRTEVASNCPGILPIAEEDKNGAMEADFQEPLPVLNFSDSAAPVINNEEDNPFVPLNDHLEADDEEPEHTERQQMQTAERGYVLRQREAPEMAGVKQNHLDPWHSLDPFASSQEKPFKKGKHYTLPGGIVDDMSSNKRKRRLPCKLQHFVKWFSSTYWTDAVQAVKSRRKGPTFADMDALYWKHAKERLAIQKQFQKRMGPQVTKVAELFVEDYPANCVEEVRDDDYLDHEDGADLSDHEDLGQSVPAILAHGLAENIEPVNLQEELSYEELVRRNVELYIANSQKYAQETVLSLRVREWEDKMGPQLQEQEEQGAFDIHDYGDRLVSQFNQVGEWRTFASLMAHRKPYEVCRYLLASLQLANDYTVELAQKPGLHEGVDTMSLCLLSQQRAHERFKTYTAPSLADK